MALPKRVKVGGSYYRGYIIAVSSASGDYTQTLTETGGFVLNTLSVTPDKYGAGDTFKIEHFNDTAATGDVVALLVDSASNMGQNSSIQFDFPAAEQVASTESLKFTYTNTASVAMNVHLLAEMVGIRKTG